MKCRSEISGQDTDIALADNLRHARAVNMGPASSYSSCALCVASARVSMLDILEAIGVAEVTLFAASTHGYGGDS